jgi:hypothetical protein
MYLILPLNRAGQQAAHERALKGEEDKHGEQQKNEPSLSRHSMPRKMNLK